MKKIILSLMIIFCLSLAGMSVFFMTGCGTTASTSGGGSSNSEEIETPEENTPQTEEPDDSSSSDENEAEGNTKWRYNIWFYTYFICASSPQQQTNGYRVTSSNVSTTQPFGTTTFKIYENTTQKTFGGTVEPSSASSDDMTYTTNGYFSYNRTHDDGWFENWTARYMEVMGNDKGNWSFCGLTTESVAPTSLYDKWLPASAEICTTPWAGSWYVYGGRQITTSRDTAKSGANSYLGQESDNGSGQAVNIIFREDRALNFDELLTTYVIECGVNFTFPDKGSRTRTGYTQAGWGTEANSTTVSYSYGQTVQFFGTAGTKRYNFYEVWTPNRYALTLNNNWPPTAGETNGGKWSDGSATCYAVYDSKTFYTSSSGGSVATITVPTCTGYTFNGYYTATSGGGTPFINSSGGLVYNWTRTSSLTVYAQWLARSYTVTLDLNSGTRASGAPSSVTATYYAVPSWQSQIGISKYYPTRTGYTFGGWTTTKNGSTVLIDTTGTVVPNVTGYTDSSRRWIYGSDSQYDTGTTVYAKWTANIYNLTLLWNAPPNTSSWKTLYVKYANGYSTSSSASSFVTSIDVSSLTRTGYVFKGFYTSETNGTQIIDASGNILKSNTYFTSSQSLYAQWEAQLEPVRVVIARSKFGADYITGGSSADGCSVQYKNVTCVNNTTKKADSWQTISGATGTFDTLVDNNFSLKAVPSTNVENGAKYHFVGWIIRAGGDGSVPTTDVNYVSGSNLGICDSNIEMEQLAYYTKTVTMYIYAYFKMDNEIYKGKDGYYYIDYGYVPQKEYKNITVTKVSDCLYFGLEGALYKDSLDYYFGYQGCYYKFEPIKWRIVMENTTLNYTTKGDKVFTGFTIEEDAWGITLVSDQVLFGSAFSDIVLARSGDCYYDSSLFFKIRDLNSATSLGGFTTGFTESEVIFGGFDRFAPDYSPDKVISDNFGDANCALRLVGTSMYNNDFKYESWSPYEDNVLAERGWKATCTDFAAKILGCTGGEYVDYWTTNLGTYTNEAKIITKYEQYTSLNMQQTAGVRLAYTLKSATYFGLVK